MTKIAIIGAGLAGLALSWHLSRLGAAVTLFDPKGIGGGASQVSTGLLHPFPGRLALRSWNAALGMMRTEELLEIATKAQGRAVFEKTGLFRPAVTEAQRRDFFLRAQEDADAIWQEHPVFGPGLWIPKGITVYSSLYLQGLWKACPEAAFSSERIVSLEQLDTYDHIVIAAGFETLQFKECSHLPLKMTKGQVLLCRWNKRLEHSVCSQGHITPTEDPDLCYIGSTYERAFTHGRVEAEKALALQEKAALFYPEARKFEVVEIRAGVRISPIDGYRPIAAQLSEKVWVFTGLGSRGLLYHALLGKELAEKICAKAALSVR
jgi:glycine/D-amino acid oxidase-like deaminating enzyme